MVVVVVVLVLVVVVVEVEVVLLVEVEVVVLVLSTHGVHLISHEGSVPAMGGAEQLHVPVQS